MNTRFHLTLTTRRAILSLALCTGLLSFGNFAHAQIYFEDFNHTSSSNNLSLSTKTWSGYIGSSATDASTTGDPSGNTANAIAFAGASSYPPYTGSPATYGALYSVNRTTVSLASAAVTTFTSATALTLSAGNTITWNMGNGSTDAGVRLLIQIGGDGTVGSGTWYASSTFYKNASSYSSFSSFTSSTGSDVTWSLTFSTLASNWDAFTLTPGSSLSLGSTLTTDLSSTTITGIGFYLVNGSSLNTGVRLDNLTVVPEPSSLALCLGALGMLLTLTRRRA